MSWTAIDNMVVREIGSIGVVAFAVYAILRMHANDAGQCCPSIQTIASIVKRSARTVQHAIGQLQDAGLVEKRAAWKGNSISANPRNQLHPFHRWG